MIEIICLIAIVRMASKIVSRRGLGIGWAFLTALLWLVGEVLGSLIGGAFELDLAGMYAVALSYAVIGAVVAFVTLEFVPAPGDQRA